LGNVTAACNGSVELPMNVPRMNSWRGPDHWDSSRVAPSKSSQRLSSSPELFPAAEVSTLAETRKLPAGSVLDRISFFSFVMSVKPVCATT